MAQKKVLTETGLSRLVTLINEKFATKNTATTSINGLLSSTDKVKLDGVETGAQVNTITGIKGNAETDYRTGNINLTAANIGALAADDIAVDSAKLGGILAANYATTEYVNNQIPTTFIGSGSTAAAGLVPAPDTTAGTTKYLREDGTWQVPESTGSGSNDEPLTNAEIEEAWLDCFYPLVTVTITQSNHQTIHVLIDDETDHTETFTVRASTQYDITVTPDTGYTAGTVTNASGTISEDMNISATEATVSTFTVTLAATENQTITLTYTEPNEEAVTVISTDVDQDISVDYNTTWTATIEAAEGYTAGILSASSGTVTEDVTVSVTEAIAISE